MMTEKERAWTSAHPRETDDIRLEAVRNVADAGCFGEEARLRAQLLVERRIAERAEGPGAKPAPTTSGERPRMTMVLEQARRFANRHVQAVGQPDPALFAAHAAEWLNGRKARGWSDLECRMARGHAAALLRYDGRYPEDGGLWAGPVRNNLNLSATPERRPVRRTGT